MWWSGPASDPGHVSVPAGLDDAADRSIGRLDHEGGTRQLSGAGEQPGYGCVSGAEARRATRAALAPDALGGRLRGRWRGRAWDRDSRRSTEHQPAWAS